MDFYFIEKTGFFHSIKKVFFYSRKKVFFLQQKKKCFFFSRKKNVFLQQKNSFFFTKDNILLRNLPWTDLHPDHVLGVVPGVGVARGQPGSTSAAVGDGDVWEGTFYIVIQFLYFNQNIITYFNYQFSDFYFLRWNHSKM